MVSQDDSYPQFPVLECQVCQERFEVPRHAVKTASMGMQIIIDWEASEEMMSFHGKSHFDTLTQEVEAYVASQVR
jgi:hypothetical protein